MDNSADIEMDLWQLYRTGDKEKMGRLFEALAQEAHIESAIAYAWGDIDGFD